MKLVTFSVTNYRSITTAHKINLGKYTVLIGKNNEGKSNILGALTWSMEFLRRYPNTLTGYEWERDFPLQFQTRRNGLQSIFRLEFSLSEDELQEFWDEIGSRLNGNIAIEISIGKENKASIKIPKQGKGATFLTSKSRQITNFISKRISINYIPAIRTEYEAINAIRGTLADELEVAEQKPEYIEALKTINSIQKEILDSIAEKIKEPLRLFMPTIKGVKIEIIEEKRRLALRRSVDVRVDDGILTNIQYKGDGVKSLAALAMLRDRNLLKSTPVIAIEEPESHLHPSAIHQLNEVIMGLAESNQVIITTHNPLFVIRDNIKSNIIVDKGKATPAKNIKEIRDILGIKASDNLTNASYVLVVEGEDDKISLNKLLPSMSDKIAKALKSNILKIEEIGGAGNLSYKLSLLTNSLCNYHVLLDNDDAGRKAYNSAEKDKLVDIKKVTFTNCVGMSNSEFEDCLNVDVYKDAILTEFGVNLDYAFKGNEKWALRMKNAFNRQGKLWNDQVEKNVKAIVANSILPNPDITLNSKKRDSIDALVIALESMLTYI